MAKQIELPKALKEEIEAHGQSSYPHECCGILFGQNNGNKKFISELLPIENAHDESPQNRYLIPPKDVLRGEKYARENNLEILGFYHSHPDVAAVPSEFDREHAWPWYSYIIVSIENGKAVELTAWELLEDRTDFACEEILETRTNI